MVSDTVIVEGGPAKGAPPTPTTLLARLDRLPDAPGVYLMKGKRGEILYIGKANVLADRVRSYFQKGADLTPKTRLWLSLVTDIETLVTRSELEALILENNLIKRHRPRFNVILRDDKNYPYLRLPIKEAFPRFSIVRKVLNDGALVYGPYVPAGARRETLRAIKKIFPLATCTIEIDGKAERPCIEYEIKRCMAPCVGYQTSQEYHEIVKQARMFLEGRDTELLETYRGQMEAAAEREDFEAAGRIRDRIFKIERALERQRVAQTENVDQDVVGLVREDAAEEMQKLLHLKKAPARIEGFDISNIQGNQGVASMVVWEAGGPKKSDYRKFRIRTVEGANDFASMKEVVLRHYSGVKEEQRPLPDLILIDGGIGQLGAAMDALRELGLSRIDIVALAKAKGEKEERVFLPGRKNPVVLKPSSPATHVLQCIRDEAHRFAIAYHRNLRSRVLLSSKLDGIPGVGPAKRRDLLRYFGSIDALTEASEEVLQRVGGVGPQTAREIRKALASSN